jgi:hypothetical protein
MGLANEIKRIARRVVESFLAEKVHTHLPAQVVSYDATTNTCSIQPCIMRMRSEDPGNLTTIELPQVDDVPVKQFGSGKLLLSVAPQADSYGVFHVSERDIEVWLTKGGVVNPGSSRKFNLSDGWFDPGAYPLKADGDNGLISPAINTDRIEMRTRLGTSYIYVKDDGKIELTTLGDATVTLDTDGTMTVKNSSGSMVVDSSGNAVFHGGSDTAVAYTDMKSAFDTLKTDLNNLVTAYNAHVHITTATVSAGPPGVLAPTTSTGTPTAADMSGAEVATVKLP